MVESLGQSFDSYEFIAACPRSGRTSSGQGCAVVQANGRSVCGRRLSRWQGAHAHRLHKDNRKSPARWHKRTPRKKGRAYSPWRAKMQAWQVRWKESVAGVQECGKYRGEERLYLFLKDEWKSNLLPSTRSAVDAHLQQHDIALHRFAHHVMSSQVFPNLGGPFWIIPHASRRCCSACPPVWPIPCTPSPSRAGYDGDPGFGATGRQGEHRTRGPGGVVGQPCGRLDLLLIEVKFSEPGFGSCSKGESTGGDCEHAGVKLVASRGSGCPLTQPGLTRRYWALAEKHQLFDWNALATGPACPFRRHGYQLMRNQLMAAVLEADTRDHRPARVDFVALVHDENPRIRTLAQPMGGTTELVEGWRSVLTDPSRFHWWKASDWVDALASTPALADWVAQMRERYFSDVGTAQGAP